MAYRTSLAEIQLLSDDFSDMTAAQMEPHIITADTIITDQGIAADSATTSTKLGLISRWLSAHFATVFVREATREKAGSVGVTYDENAERGFRLESTRFGKNAILLDSTGALAKLNASTNKPQVASVKTLHRTRDWW